MELNKEIAFQTFKVRHKKAKKDGQIDDSMLHAGSPMHYYCNGCECLVATLPENWFLNAPPKYCDPCKVLAEHGLLSEALALSEKE